MTKIRIQTESIDSFFARAKRVAKRADEGKRIRRQVTLSFEDPQVMLSVLSEARQKLIRQVLSDPVTISDLADRLKRHRSAVSKDIGLLEKLGLVITEKKSNPGHGVQKLIRATAPKIELVATLEP